ncbi:Histidine acid phosphatase family protein [Aphelenchoides avenae]|nr:Histidine acid phosphatase family protein [Aphelenchus avenae]
MRKLALVIGLSLARLSLVISSSAERELAFVQAIWRHGDRAPSGLPYPTDPYDEIYWPRGWSQLTNLGMQQCRELGEFFRQRYAGTFVNTSVVKNQIYVRSSDSDRALTSAQSFLSGFYPPDERELFDNGLRWQPIAVHASGVDVPDPLLKPTGFDCPEYDETAKKLNQNLHDAVTKHYRELFAFLANVAGYGPNITLHDVAGLNDINRELAHNLSQPDWVYRRWDEYGGYTTLELVTELRRVERINQFNKKPLYRLRGGYLLGDWLKRAKSVASGKHKKPKKMMLYSSHDGTLQSLLYALEVAPDHQIPYAACIIMELYRTDDGKYEVELFYRNNGGLDRLVHKKCSAACPLDKFLDILDDNAIYSEKKLYKKCNNVQYCDVGASSTSAGAICH